MAAEYESVAAQARPEKPSVRVIRNEIAALIFLSLGGFLMHARLHPVSFDPTAPENPAHFIPFMTGILGAIAVPLLLARRKTAITGYLINGMSVVIGTVVMAHSSLAAPPRPPTIQNIFLETTLPVILILFAKLFIGQRVLLYYYPHGRGRMFTTGWWTRHFIYLTAIYILGYILWK